jgi:3-hydroxyacyl-CoA dehydrogenase
MEKTVETRLIAVVGAGAMGSGIAQVAATSGFRVTLSDVSAAVLEKALASIRKSLWRCRGAMGIAGAVACRNEGRGPIWTAV